MQIFEASDRSAFDQFLDEQDGPVLQSWAWGEFQKKIGRKVWRLLVSTNIGKSIAAATIIRLPTARDKCFFYCPRGPVIAGNANIEKVWQLILDKVNDHAITEKPIFFRVDPEVVAYPGGFILQAAGFAKIPWEIQARSTLLLDLQKSEEQLLHGMKPKTRYNIHLAQKKGISIAQFATGSKMKIFWGLMRQTTRRDNFSAHPYVYYFNLLETLGKTNQAKLFIATYQQRPLVGAIVSFFANKAVYLHGASSDRLRGIMAPYLVQWAAIRAAKNIGFKYYDFGGVAGAGSKLSHPWAGISRFKAGFGGSEVTYLGAYDYVYQKLWYRLYRAVRSLSQIF